MIGERIAPRHHDDARRVRDVRIRGRTGVASHVVRTGVRVVDVELAILRVVRVEREAEKAALVTSARDVVHNRIDVEERRREQGWRRARHIDDANAACLLQHEEPSGIARRVRDIGRKGEAGADDSPGANSLSVRNGRNGEGSHKRGKGELRLHKSSRHQLGARSNAVGDFRMLWRASTHFRLVCLAGVTTPRQRLKPTLHGP